MKTLKQLNLTISSLALISFGLISNQASADQQILDDLIVVGSACVGQDCVNGESFGFDTLRLKENNLRIKAQDTSTSASFPSRDWQITFNDSTNGGANKFSIDDIDGGRTPFTIEAGAPSHSLYVEDGGRLGLGTSTPVVDVHVKSGNTPTMRLEQDGTSGFGAQTWDMAGNEANFFIRDASNGSTLPFRIYPGAPSNALTIEASTGDIGLGTTSPDAELEIENNGRVDLYLNNTSADNWRLTSRGTGFEVGVVGGANDGLKLTVAANGDTEIQGGLLVQGDINSTGTTVVPDYVFESDYKLMSLTDLDKYIKSNKHLPNILSAKEIGEQGHVNVSKMQMKLLEKIEELTLYTLKQQKTIDQQQQVNMQQEKTIAENSRLKERLASLEKLVTNLASSQKLLSEKGSIVATK